MEKSYESMKWELEDGLAVLTWTQPKRGNVIDKTFCEDFKKVVLDLSAQKDLRAILIRAEGRAFSFGGDLVGFKEAGDDLPNLVRQMLAEMNVAISRFFQLPVVIVAEVNGFCMGGMVGLIAGADYIVCDESAKFGAAFSGVGFSCDSGSSTNLTMRMGPARARRFELCAETLSAEEALACNLVDKVVPDEELSEAAMKMAKRFAAGPTQAYAGIKQLFLAASGIDIDKQGELECTVLARVSESADSKEGTVAMLEKRKAVYTGK